MSLLEVDAINTYYGDAHALFDVSFPYIMAVHQGPKGDAPYHLHLEFYPPMRSAERLKYLAGSELGAGTFINDTFAEEKAAELRQKIEACPPLGDERR